ncbi:MAG: ribosome silencing factor [Gammaproteobacteria bacterium]|nr:ribosome silencing factor [Gammaproteobacteria bacterium]
MNLSQTESLVVTILDDLKGINIKVLNVEGMTSIADRMILCSGRSNRHVNSIANNLVAELKKNYLQPLGVEGLNTSEWVLVDIGDIIVHIMQQDTRDFYNLEALWGNVPVITERSSSNQCK